MDPETKKLIQEQFVKLPKQLQDAIQSSHIHELIASIAQAHKLHIDQVGPFENEIMLLMMGFTDPIEFVGELKSNLAIDADTAQAIAVEVNQQILIPIREKMENGESFAPPEPPKSAPAITNTPVPLPVTDTKSVVMPSAAKAAGTMTDIKPATAPVVSPASAIPASAPTTPAQGSGPISKPVSLPVEASAKSGAPTPAAVPMAKPVLPPVVTSVAPTTPVAPVVDKVLSQPTVSAAPKQPVVIPDSKPAVAPTVPAQPIAPPPPPPVHKVDPYREPID